MSEVAETTVYFHSAIARALKDNGVATIFGLIGDANLYMVDAFIREQQGEYVSAANEAGAVIMALGYASVTGRPGVATVTHGPAVTNTLTGLVEGVKGQLPMLLVCGDTSVEARGHLQDCPQRELIVATGAGFEQLRSPASLSQDVAIALRRAVLERRPIALNVPVDFQWREVAYRQAARPPPTAEGRAPAGEAFDNAVGIIAAARRPVILAGRGAIDPGSRAALVRLAERIGAPLATTLRAKGLFRGEAFDLGVFGTLSTPPAAEAIQGADCLIAFGAGLNIFTAALGAFVKGKRIVQCNTELADLAQVYPVDAALAGDPAAVAGAIVAALDEAEISASGFRTEALSDALAAFSPVAGLPDMGTSATVDSRRAVYRLGKAIPAERTVVVDGGRFMGSAWQYLDVPEPRAYVHTINFGAIGLGVSYGIGAAVGVKGRPTLVVAGDGGFMLGGLVEFNTAVRHGLDLIVILCNDSAYGAEHIQFRNKNMDPSLSMFAWPQFADVARSLGGDGVTVRNAADLEAAETAIRARTRPLLIDLKCDPDHMPPIPL
ncbi:MAG TPA: thiamine pyrophosphate-binding protein [Caulobacteraceae bacterium]|nr:thiamine pyrophosphate-binding protein [Caulobacteraceae bacterium]